MCFRPPIAYEGNRPRPTVDQVPRRTQGGEVKTGFAKARAQAGCVAKPTPSIPWRAASVFKQPSANTQLQLRTRKRRAACEQLTISKISWVSLARRVLATARAAPTQHDPAPATRARSRPRAWRVLSRGRAPTRRRARVAFPRRRAESGRRRALLVAVAHRAQRAEKSASGVSLLQNLPGRSRFSLTREIGTLNQ